MPWRTFAFDTSGKLTTVGKWEGENMTTISDAQYDYAQEDEIKGLAEIVSKLCEKTKTKEVPAKQ